MATSVTKVGDATVTLVEELILPTSVRWLFPDAEAPFELLEAARSWLEPHFINERGHLLQSIGSFVVTLDGMTVVVDTGVGNDKQRGGGIPEFNMRSGTFLQDFRAAGYETRSRRLRAVHPHAHRPRGLEYAPRGRHVGADVPERALRHRRA